MAGFTTSTEKFPKFRPASDLLALEDRTSRAGKEAGRGCDNAQSAAGFAELAALYGAAASEALAETLWPTRCAVCDEPGEVLCEACRRNLPYLDWWRACPRCGAPFGRVQCTECNAVMMARLGRKEPPFAACASATVFASDSARIVRTWKDSGERRLSQVMAEIMAQAVPPSWMSARPAVVPIPASARAVRRRGFDHGLELAHAVAEQLDLPIAELLARPHSVDQRKLSRKERLENMEGRFRALPGADAPATVILTDDVLTTGATLYAATDALLEAGTQEVWCLTFSRVW